MFKEAVIAILAAVAKQEHARLSKRVVAGLKRAKRQGKTLGRPKAIVDREKIREARATVCRCGRSVPSSGLAARW